MELIDRDKAIEAILEYYDESDMDEARYMIENVWLKDVPTVNKWIPCSERLPEAYGEYLVTCEPDLPYRGHKTITDKDDYFAYGWDDYGDKVIAWMPLPEPWKGEPV